ncbi:MAG: sodium/proline symporter [Calditrichota bacterium]
METLNTPVLGLIVYLIAVLAVGALTWGRNRTKEDFIIGSRRLGSWVIALSERTAAESAWLILGLSGAVYWIGMGEMWTVFGCVTGIILSWILIAKPLRTESERLGAITLPEYFAQRAGSHAQAVRIISTLIIVFFFSFYVGAQFVGSSKVMNVTFSIPPLWGMAIGAVVIIVYTMMGGFLAVCLTDVVQAVLMIVTLVGLPIVGLIVIATNGLDIGAALAATRQTSDFFNGKLSWEAAALAIGGLSWGFGYMGQPHLVTKFMAIRRPEDIRRGRSIAIVWTFLAYGGAVLCGIVGITLLHHGQLSAGLLQDAAGVADAERVLPVLADYLFPAWFAGILISGAVAAMMSTADSQLLVATSAVVEDFYSRTLRRSLSHGGMVLFSRLVTVAVGVFGFALAMTTTDLIYKMVSYAWAGLGSAFGPALVLALYWKRTNAAGIIAGMLTGAISTVVWTEIPALNTVISVRVVSFILAFIAVIVGTSLSRIR